jgi:hypothetical protein
MQIILQRSKYIKERGSQEVKKKKGEENEE